MWNNCTQYESNDLYRIQNEAARIVTGSTKLAYINSLFTNTGSKTLESRRKKNKLTMFYKVIKGLCPDHLTSPVPVTIGSTSKYPLHKSSDLQTLHTNSCLRYYIPFLPSVDRDWKVIL